VHARFAFLGAVLLAAALAACGGGGGGGGGTPPTPVPTATPCATPAGGGVGFCGTTGATTVPVAAGATYVATMNFSAGSGSAVLTASTTPPSGIPVLDVAHMRNAAKARIASTAPYTTLGYITLTATSAVSLSTVPTITVTSPSGASGAYYNAQGFWVSLPQSGSFTLASGATAYFAIYTGGTLPSPNPDGCVGVQPDATTRIGAHASLVGVQPIVSGAGFSYTGTLTGTIARAEPCPMPTATQQATVTVAVTVTSSPSGSTDEHSVENDAYLTNTTTTTTDAIVAATTVGSSSGFSESSETSNDGNNDITTTTYGTPLVYAIASPLPYTGTITNAPPSSVVADFADGTTSNRSYNTANGSYTEADTIVGGGQNDITVNPDFSGNYTIFTPSGQLEAAFSAPSGGSITFTETYAGTTLTTFALPQWWTGSSLYSDTMVDNGAGALPSPCNPTPTVNSADDFRRTISIVDPVLGYTEKETIDAYVVGGSPTVGPACVVIADTQQLYYDYFYDTPYSIYLSGGGAGAPLQTDTISEAYWYASGPTGATSVRTMSENPGGIPGLAANIAAHASGIAFTRVTQRTQRIESFVRSVLAGHIGGAK
jgi:hypothetical protein